MTIRLIINRNILAPLRIQPKCISIALGLVMFTVLLACTSDSQKQEAIDSFKLQSLEEQNSFLEELYATDQAPREKSSQFQNGSPEMRQVMLEISRVDSLNYLAISSYLSDYGYPDTESFSEQAQIAPWIILHHASDPVTRIANVNYIEEGYHNGALSSGRFWGYLSRTYQMKFHERASIDSERGWSTKQKIPSLLTLLRLHTAAQKPAECSASEDFEQILIKTLVEKDLKQLYLKADSSHIEIIFDKEPPSKPMIELYGKSFNYVNLQDLSSQNPPDPSKEINRLYMHYTRSGEVAQIALVSLFHSESYLVNFKSFGCYWQLTSIVDTKK